MTTARRLHHTYQEYLAALKISGVKLEYCDGEITRWPAAHRLTPT